MTEFKVGDRVEVIAPDDAFTGSSGTVKEVNWLGLPRVAIDGVRSSPRPYMDKDELRHAPTTHTRGTHPNSLANLLPGQERREGEWEEKRLRLSTGACDWLRRQGRGNMSKAVERLIMEAIEREEPSDDTKTN